MSHSYYKIWIHAVWATKERYPFIRPEIESQIYSFLANQFKEAGCPIRIINGMPDHIHCLFLLNSKLSLSEIIKQIKGSSSHFINKENLIKEKFSWQTGYSAFSVSESAVDKVHKYITNQKPHHQKQTFHSEYEEFLELHNLKMEN